MNRGILTVVSGFSGAGKGTLMKELLSRYDEYALSISMTTRSPREGETNGKEYFFVSAEEFEDTIQKDGLLEYARYVDNYYGTPKKYVEDMLKSGKNVILEIEVQGAVQIKEKYPEALLLFVSPPNASELERRLTGRGTESKDTIVKRMKRAVKEADDMSQYDFIIINDDLDECVIKMHAIIQTSKYSPLRAKDFISRISQELKEKTTVL